MEGRNLRHEGFTIVVITDSAMNNSVQARTLMALILAMITGITVIRTMLSAILMILIQMEVHASGQVKGLGGGGCTSAASSFKKGHAR